MQKFDAFLGSSLGGINPSLLRRISLLTYVALGICLGSVLCLVCALLFLLLPFAENPTTGGSISLFTMCTSHDDCVSLDLDNATLFDCHGSGREAGATHFAALRAFGIIIMIFLAALIVLFSYVQLCASPEERKRECLQSKIVTLLLAIADAEASSSPLTVAAANRSSGSRSPSIATASPTHYDVLTAAQMLTSPLGSTDHVPSSSSAFVARRFGRDDEIAAATPPHHQSDDEDQQQHEQHEQNDAKTIDNNEGTSFAAPAAGTNTNKTTNSTTAVVGREEVPELAITATGSATTTSAAAPGEAEVAEASRSSPSGTKPPPMPTSASTTTDAAEATAAAAAAAEGRFPHTSLISIDGSTDGTADLTSFTPRAAAVVSAGGSAPARTATTTSGVGTRDGDGDGEGSCSENCSNNECFFAIPIDRVFSSDRRSGTTLRVLMLLIAVFSFSAAAMAFHIGQQPHLCRSSSFSDRGYERGSGLKAVLAVAGITSSNLIFAIFMSASRDEHEEEDQAENDWDIELEAHLLEVKLRALCGGGGGGSVGGFGGSSSSASVLGRMQTNSFELSSYHNNNNSTPTTSQSLRANGGSSEVTGSTNNGGRISNKFEPAAAYVLLVGERLRREQQHQQQRKQKQKQQNPTDSNKSLINSEDGSMSDSGCDKYNKRHGRSKDRLTASTASLDPADSRTPSELSGNLSEAEDPIILSSPNIQTSAASGAAAQGRAAGGNSCSASGKVSAQHELTDDEATTGSSSSKMKTNIKRSSSASANTGGLIFDVASESDSRIHDLPSAVELLSLSGEATTTTTTTTAAAGGGAVEGSYRLSLTPPSATPVNSGDDDDEDGDVSHSSSEQKEQQQQYQQSYYSQQQTILGPQQQQQVSVPTTTSGPSPAANDEAAAAAAAVQDQTTTTTTTTTTTQPVPYSYIVVDPSGYYVYYAADGTPVGYSPFVVAPADASSSSAAAAAAAAASPSSPYRDSDQRPPPPGQQHEGTEGEDQRHSSGVASPPPPPPAPHVVNYTGHDNVGDASSAAVERNAVVDGEVDGDFRVIVQRPDDEWT